ncbi:beta-lactamase regulating signal transducer with metallopeptidase domain [Silvibacterium bohemicum]|uniref:Beta-lactamase regulating signal transducer with metallopeptidase domain n=1 Tax=Silvibacterium bohemicum TaxID=1577686 RepID=A0A841JPV8_9BACT|nr:beta-lactamase regulating signal transducer with metallopeptidase domain [Silvibacterium bohemicum]
MVFPAIWNETWTAALVNHLWQSTVVIVFAWLLTLALRKNQARMRYRVWMIASIKFLLPFTLLISAGESLQTKLATPVQHPAIAAAMQQITQPFPASSTSNAAFFDGEDAWTATPQSHSLPLILATLWLCGFLAITFSWARSWWKLRATVRTSSPMTIFADVPVLSSARLFEPGIFGILRPVLLMPENITDRLSADQLRAILAHEMCHVRRRDNLTAAIHVMVQALFWFHPAVWWIKARLIEERERACDEAVLQSGNEPELYAESILNVCKFYVESPLACMSGVTGSDLKRRIVRIMTEQVTRKLDFSRKLLLGAAAAAAVAIPMIFGLTHTAQVRAQSTAETAGLSGTWQGTLHAGKDLRIVAKFTKGDDGAYKGMFYSIDQGGNGIPADKVTLDGTTVKMAVGAIGGTYDGKLSSDGNTITGNWSQGPTPVPLVFIRATPATEWTIPPAAPPTPPMAADANPSFEVATIKPSTPNRPGKGFGFRSGKVMTMNTNLNDLIAFAYGLHTKQIVDAPAWFGTDLYDIQGKHDAEGRPSPKQMELMMQKLLAERFKLTFHHDKRELSVYVITVANGGPKMTKTASASNAPPTFVFRSLGDLLVRNLNMAEFAT